MNSYLPETRTIASGVSLTSVKMTDFKTDYIAFNIINPLDKETDASNTLLYELLLAGNKEYKSNFELNRALDFLYDSDLSTVSSPAAMFHLNVLSSTMLNGSFTPDKTDVLGGTLGIIASLLCRPDTENRGLNRRYFDDRKNKALAALAARINNKRVYSQDRLCEEMFRGECNEHPASGTPEEIEALTPEDLYEAYLRNEKYSRIEIFHAGRTDIDILAEKISCLFSSVDRSEYTELKDTYVIKERADTIKRIDEEQPVQQGILCIGFRNGGIRYSHPLFPAFIVFNELYGGSPTSRLFSNVREKSHLCYYCSSRPGTPTATMFVQSGIKNENRDAAEEQILYWLDDMKKGNIGEEETRRAKLALTNGLKTMHESRGVLGTFYLNRTLMGGFETPLQLKERMEKVTPEDVAKVAGMVTPDTIYFMKGGAE